eukprot:NODE_3661_length_1181_cov_26.697543_g3477_i0.p1 GENE.NODE_3661_length_1181_cov_26.697543_g3477_i0~~NODE_3661_length_1181_cov_26.697543_g3477_i0.p1  ORF type:complete len:318 (+),score=40.04 NODE_3661_length_1181_cov_26.697543_g3477_i0:50-955(+)
MLSFRRCCVGRGRLFSSWSYAVKEIRPSQIADRNAILIQQARTFNEQYSAIQESDLEGYLRRRLSFVSIIRALIRTPVATMVCDDDNKKVSFTAWGVDPNVEGPVEQTPPDFPAGGTIFSKLADGNSQLEKQAGLTFALNVADSTGELIELGTYPIEMLQWTGLQLLGHSMRIHLNRPLTPESLAAFGSIHLSIIMSDKGAVYYTAPDAHGSFLSVYVSDVHRDIRILELTKREAAKPTSEEKMAWGYITMPFGEFLKQRESLPEPIVGFSLDRLPAEWEYIAGADVDLDKLDLKFVPSPK